MNYRIPTVIMLLTLALGIVVTISSFPPAVAEVTQMTKLASSSFEANEDLKEFIIAHDQKEATSLLSESNQIKLLVGIVALMFFGYMWWVQRYISRNDQRHDKQDTAVARIAKNSQATAVKLQEIIGEHRMSMQLRGCGNDPNILRDAITEALSPLNLYVHQRTEDPPDVMTVTGRSSEIKKVEENNG